VTFACGVTTRTVLRFRDTAALVKFGHMLENPSYPFGTRRKSGSENPKGDAENQQERLVRSEPKSSETYTPDIDPWIDEDKVRSAWRHAGCNVLRKQCILICNKIIRQINNIAQSEIPCRVSNIAQGSGDTIPMTGSNRWNPNDVCASASRAIPRVRFETGASAPARFPVTTQGVRSLDGRKAITRRP
jgi:hypothetical protein